MMKSIATVAAVAAVAASGAAADEVLCPVPISSISSGEICGGVIAALQEPGGVSVEEAVQIAESGVGGLMLGSGAPQTADLTANFRHDGGDFQFCSGFCTIESLPDGLWDAISAAATEAELEPLRKQFAEACVGSNASQGQYMLFDDASDDPGSSTSINDFALPANVVFWIVPNMKVSEIDLDVLYGATDESERRPLFSLSSLNIDSNDHFLLIRDDAAPANVDQTLFVWEDKDRSFTDGLGVSDSDFGDLTFRLNVEIQPEITVGDEFCDPERPDLSVCTRASKRSPDTNSVTLTWANNPALMGVCPR